MSVEFIGIARTADASETATEVGAAVQPDYLYRIARAHERSGFDRVLITQDSASPDGFVVAGQVLNVTRKLGVLLVHRPGFIAPTAAARMFATLDAMHPGRVALHASTGGEDDDQARDGDFADKAARYRRTDEFLDVVRLTWASAAPFDYSGEFYQVNGGWSSVRPAGGRLPIYFAGASADAIRVGGRHADVYTFWGEPLAGIRELIGKARVSAASAWRTIDRFSVSLRPITASTEAAAWDRARELLELARDQVSVRASEPAGPQLASSQWTGSQWTGSEPASSQAPMPQPAMPQAEGARRLLRYATAAELHDQRLWTALARVTGAPGNSTALVGSYEQVGESLLRYVAAGASSLIIRGYDPLADAAAYGDLIRFVHDRVAGDLKGYRARAAA